MIYQGLGRGEGREERRGEEREERAGKRGEERRGEEREERIEDGRGEKGGRKMSGKGGKLKGVMDSYQIAATFLTHSSSRTFPLRFRI